MDGGGSTVVGRDRERSRLVAEVEADRTVAVVAKRGSARRAWSARRRRRPVGGCTRAAGSRRCTIYRSWRSVVRSTARSPAMTRPWRPRSSGAWVRISCSSTISSGRIDRRPPSSDSSTAGSAWWSRSGLGDPGTTMALSLARLLGAVEIDLVGLDDDQARAVARTARPDLAASDLERVVARAGGNPLLLAEMAIRGEPSLALARSIHAGLDHLSAAGRRETLEVLALIDRPVDGRRLGEALRGARADRVPDRPPPAGRDPACPHRGGDPRRPRRPAAPSEAPQCCGSRHRPGGGRRAPGPGRVAVPGRSHGIGGIGDGRGSRRAGRPARPRRRCDRSGRRPRPTPGRRRGALGRVRLGRGRPAPRAGRRRRIARRAGVADWRSWRTPCSRSAGTARRDRCSIGRTTSTRAHPGRGSPGWPSSGPRSGSMSTGSFGRRSRT